MSERVQVGPVSDFPEGWQGTVEVGGTTDFARWVPLADFPLRERTADIVTLALQSLGRA